MTLQQTHTVFLSLGSNLEPRLENLTNCSQSLNALTGMEVLGASSIYESAALDMPTGTPAFLNQVLSITTTLNPEELLNETEALEKQLGRTEKGQALSRTIDIDILLYSDKTINTDRLIIPHPRLHLRAFTLIPLLELDNTLKNPNTGQPYCQSLKDDFTGTLTKFSAQRVALL